MPIRYVVLDFDGTCTQVDRIQQRYLDAFRGQLEKAWGRPLGAEWTNALKAVRQASPEAGWTLGGAPAAPACADPYIQAGEAAGVLQRTWAAKGIAVQVPVDAHEKSYSANPAPFRPELREVLHGLRERGVSVGFISNSATGHIAGRLTDLLAGEDAFREQIPVVGNAAKFRVQELAYAPLGPGHAHRAHFHEVMPAIAVEGLQRPVYLRRGGYFEALCRFWSAFGASRFAAEETLVCGDVWELDLALPRELGAAVHLIERAKPFDTYAYELKQAGADASRDLHGLLAHLDRLNGKPKKARKAG